ncbi:hypothetical protein DAEQUDRAFT_248581 [Daedalea quercina L-15889]|uniref:F-box domain-containing protein n=1 Tax=Daedalea quercina L-15889 TaxID=1314783 RepID=A0A165QMG0_9APHY|nr:hypothetical protein DAEQUDRAFT_248581 [Daedalea quercina L-15889]
MPGNLSQHVGNLPQEIIDMIIRNVYDDPSDRETLESGLTCRAWLPASREELFHSVELYNPSQVLAFSKHLRRSSHLASHVRTLEIMMCDDDIDSPSNQVIYHFPFKESSYRSSMCSTWFPLALTRMQVGSAYHAWTLSRSWGYALCHSARRFSFPGSSTLFITSRCSRWRILPHRKIRNSALPPDDCLTPSALVDPTGARPVLLRR